MGKPASMKQWVLGQWERPSKNNTKPQKLRWTEMAHWYGDSWHACTHSHSHTNEFTHNYTHIHTTRTHSHANSFTNIHKHTCKLTLIVTHIHLHLSILRHMLTHSHKTHILILMHTHSPHTCNIYIHTNSHTRLHIPPHTIAQSHTLWCTHMRSLSYIHTYTYKLRCTHTQVITHTCTQSYSGCGLCQIPLHKPVYSALSRFHWANLSWVMSPQIHSLRNPETVGLCLQSLGLEQESVGATILNKKWNGTLLATSSNDSSWISPPWSKSSLTLVSKKRGWFMVLFL